MQYKKDELKAIILTEAEREFFANGYHNASLRQIAKRAGTTIGNLYNYFDSKAAVFDELVQGEYQSFVLMMKSHAETTNISKTMTIDEYQLLREAISNFIQQLMPVFSRKFLIMLELSAGTKYENTKVEFIDFLYQHFLEHMDSSKQAVTLDFARLIAVQCIDGILYVIRNYDDGEMKYQMIRDLLFFNIIGVIGISGIK